jgi:hypothetical protein
MKPTAAERLRVMYEVPDQDADLWQCGRRLDAQAPSQDGMHSIVRRLRLAFGNRAFTTKEAVPVMARGGIGATRSMLIRLAFGSLPHRGPRPVIVDGVILIRDITRWAHRPWIFADAAGCTEEKP